MVEARNVAGAQRAMEHHLTAVEPATMVSTQPTAISVLTADR
jgi:hypothetical protein